MHADDRLLPSLKPPAGGRSAARAGFAKPESVNNAETKTRVARLEEQTASAWDQALEQLNKPSGWDYTLSKFDGWRLQISSGTSGEMQRPIACFCGVSYVSCPTEFSHPRFRRASLDEVKAVERVVPIGDGDLVVAIDAETMSGIAAHVFFVVAQSVELVAP